MGQGPLQQVQEGTEGEIQKVNTSRCIVTKRESVGDANRQGGWPWYVRDRKARGVIQPGSEKNTFWRRREKRGRFTRASTSGKRGRALVPPWGGKGILRRGEGRWKAKETHRLEVPSSLPKYGGSKICLVKREVRGFRSLSGAGRKNYTREDSPKGGNAGEWK